jgi:serine-type D-Ala-D-Ala carboxypeptidase (penicillin-binding protein 5/6)
LEESLVADWHGKVLPRPASWYIKVFMKTLAFLIVLLFPVSVLAADVTAESYLLVEKETFSIVAGKDYHRPLPPASTTKVMTAILALERLDEQENIVPTKKVLSIPASKLSLYPGKPYKAIDLIQGAMIESANDAAYSLSVAVAGSEERFAEMMNEKAREIGARDSHFENASGLHLPNHVSSAYDLALILRYALQNKRFEQVIGTKYFMFNRGDVDVKYMNHNRLLFCFQPSIGGKTGFTRASRHCYVGAFEKDGKTYILSLLGSRNLWGDACSILQNVFTDVPTEQEIHLAKANNIVLSSYRVKQTVHVQKERKLEKKKVKKAKGKAKKVKTRLRKT